MTAKSVWIGHQIWVSARREHTCAGGPQAGRRPVRPAPRPLPTTKGFRPEIAYAYKSGPFDDLVVYIPEYPSYARSPPWGSFL
jgi:hypothetical protein